MTVNVGADPIKSVRAISTGSGEVHPEHIFGTRKPELWWIFTSRRWIPTPINVFVIEHTRGLVLFDAGMDRAVASEPNYFGDRMTALFMLLIGDLAYSVSAMERGQIPGTGDKQKLRAGGDGSLFTSLLT